MCRDASSTVLDGTLQIENPNALGGIGSGSTIEGGATLPLAGAHNFIAEDATVSSNGINRAGALYNAAIDNT